MIESVAQGADDREMIHVMKDDSFSGPLYYPLHYSNIYVYLFFQYEAIS